MHSYNCNFELYIIQAVIAVTILGEEKYLSDNYNF